MELPNLSTLFNERIFRIPDYQRGYSWEESQLNDFWNDLKWLGEGKNHYTGMITLAPILEAQGIPVAFKAFHVVDGQQRLTTAFILINCIVKRANALGMSYIADRSPIEYLQKYVHARSSGRKIPVLAYTSEEKTDFLYVVVADEDPPSERRAAKTIYERRLVAATSFLQNNVDQLQSEELDDLMRKLTAQIVFDQKVVDQNFAVCAMFESINYRGKRLTQFEVLKNRLMYLSEFMPVETSDINVQEELRSLIEKAWASAYDWFGKTEVDTDSSEFDAKTRGYLDEDKFLKDHTLMYFGKLDRKKDALEHRLFKQEFSLQRVESSGENSLTIEKLRNYVNSLQTSARLWACQNSMVARNDSNLKWLTAEVKKSLSRLNRLGERHFGSAILGALNVYAHDESSQTVSDLHKLLSQLESFIFIHYGLCGYRASDSARSEFQQVGFDLFWRTDGYDLDKFRVDLEEYLVMSDTEEKDEYVGSFHPEYVEQEVKARREKSSGWYSWSELKYFLSEWEEHLAINEGCLAELDFDTLTIEHILPAERTPQGSKVKKAKTRNTQYKKMVNDLGNLTLLDEKLNASLRDLPFAEKLPKYAQSCDGRHIGKMAGRKQDWSPKEIQERGMQMLKFMSQRWNVPAQEPKNKLKLNLSELLVALKKD